jgi:hypothetical protein
VRLQLLVELISRAGVARLAHDLQAIVLLEQRPITLTHHRVVIDE